MQFIWFDKTVIDTLSKLHHPMDKIAIGNGEACEYLYLYLFKCMFVFYTLRGFSQPQRMRMSESVLFFV